MKKYEIAEIFTDIDDEFIANAKPVAQKPIVLRSEPRSKSLVWKKCAATAACLAVLGTGSVIAVKSADLGAGKNVSESPLNAGVSIENGDNSENSTIDMSDFDPNSPTPVEVVLPDGKPLTYKDMVGGSFSKEYSFWATDTTVEEIAQMDDLFENFYDIISEGKEDAWDGFTLNNCVYLPESGSDKYKRYNVGDIYCGMEIGTCYASFDENCKYVFGSIWFNSSAEIADVEVTRIADNTTSTNFHFSGLDYFRFTSSDPKLTALTGGLDNEFIEGKIDLYTSIPLNTPVKATISRFDLAYCADESCYCDSDKPAITFSARMTDFQPFNEDTEQWVEKGLTAPCASAPDDFNFLCNECIDAKWLDEIYAVDDGEVVDKEDDRVVIKHGENLYTTYYYINVSVGIGDKVKAGDVIGTAYYGGESDCYFTYKFTLNQPNLSQPNLMY